MGTGKTSLIRGLKENYVPDSDHLLPHTLKVTPYNYDREGLNFVFFDTPGLNDKASKDSFFNDYENLKDMVKKNEESDLIIFAVKMSYVFRDEDAEAIGHISNAFGWKVWKNAMFVLTFANMVTSEGHSPESADSKLYFNYVFNEHYSRIVEALRSNRVHEDVIYSISVVPVGLVSQPKIPSDKRGVSWIDELWEEALKVLRDLVRLLKRMLRWMKNQKVHLGGFGNNRDVNTVYCFFPSHTHTHTYIYIYIYVYVYVCVYIYMYIM